jgi:hypothetical protein
MGWCEESIDFFEWRSGTSLKAMMDYEFNCFQGRANDPSTNHEHLKL